jgi:hypothetical protein
MKKLIGVILLLLVAVPAQAGFLQIVGDPDLKFIVKDGKVRITGSIELANQGNELSPEVNATMKIGQWNWAGVPVKLDQKAKNNWMISDEVGINKLACPENSLCSNLPLKGRFPLFLQRIYRDLNLYSFSSPSIKLVDIGELKPDERARLMNPAIVGKMELKGKGTVFEGHLDLRNTGSKDADVFVDTFTSNELQVHTKAQIIKVPAASNRQIDIKVESFTGIPGSTYAVYACFQWADGDFRISNFAETSIFIEKPKESKLYMILGFAGLGAVGLISLWFALRRKKNQT